MYYFVLIVLPLILLIALIILLRRKKKSVKSLVIWTVSACIVFTLMAYVKITYEKVYVFNQKKWKGDRESRWRMEKDLLKSRILENKDSSEVLILLGLPDRRIDSVHRWVYEMGQGGGGLGMLIHRLNIDFEGKKVKTVEHLEFK